MTQQQRSLIEAVRAALYNDPDLQTGIYIIPAGSNYASYVSRSDIIDALTAIFEEAT